MNNNHNFTVIKTIMANYCLFFNMLFNLVYKRRQNMKKYGYIRVSSKDQNPERQYAALESYGILKKNIYMDQISGKNFKRPAYRYLLGKMKHGDVLVIKSIDRLGRNYQEILEQWRKITKEIGVDIQVIDMPLLNTNSMNADLTGVFIADLVLQILAYVAETERVFMKQRQEEGIAVAKQKGVQFGPKKIEMPKEFDFYYEKWKNGEISSRKGAEYLNISHSTFYRRCKEKNKKNCNKK